MYRNRLSAPHSFLRMAVDPISNTVAITKANPLYAPSQSSKDANSLSWAEALSNGTMRDDLIWPILHELTHHSSLQTPVGNSLGALAVSHTSSIGAAACDSDHLKGPARDIVRYRAADTFFRPLLEGLALFSEFDASSGDVPVASWTSQVAARLFCFAECRDAVLAGKDFLSPMKKKLERLRQSNDVIARKKELLSRRLDDPDGYLLGYLLVKAIWVDLTTRQSVWRHSDMFTMFLNDYFFNDFLLAHLLVSAQNSPIQEESAILQIYLHNRVVLLSQNCGKFGTEFERYYLTEGAPRPSYQNYSESLEDRLHWEWTSRTLRGMCWHTPEFRSTRCIPRILAAASEVRIDEEGLFEAKFYDGTPSMYGPALEAGRSIRKEVAKADGSVEAVVLLPQHGRKDMRVVICVFLDKDLIATFGPVTGEFNDPDAAEACDQIASFLAIESFVEQVEDEKWLPENCAAAVMLDEFAGDQAAEKMLELWGPFALVPDVAEDERPDALRELRRSGLKGTLDIDDASLRRLVEFSLLPLDATVPKQPRGLVQDAAWIGTVNERSRSLFGFRLFMEKNDKLLPSRI